ncbi:hypothetical protein E4T91_10345, partial [Ligilactobacillus murinus]
MLFRLYTFYCVIILLHYTAFLIYHKIKSILVYTKRAIKVPSVNSTYQTAIAARSARIRCRNCNSTCSASSELTDHGCQ